MIMNNSWFLPFDNKKFLKYLLIFLITMFWVNLEIMNKLNTNQKI